MGSLKFDFSSKSNVEACGITKEEFIKFQSKLIMTIKEQECDTETKVTALLESLMDQGDPVARRIICMYAVKGISSITDKIISMMNTLSTMGISEEAIQKMQAMSKSKGN